MRLIDRFLISFLNTDEIFAVASGNEGTVGRRYLYGLILTPFIGWTSGTLIGAVAGNILPSVVTSALGIAIYAMFIAIVIPPAKKNSAIAGVAILSVALNCIISYVPVFDGISGGMAIIICAVISSAVFSVIRPVKEETE